MSAPKFSYSRRQVIAAGLANIATLSALGASHAAWAQEGKRVLRIGYQKGWLSILKQRGALEKRLALLGVQVTWAEFTAGPVQLEALNVGSIDFGNVGDAPPIFAQAAGAPLVYAATSVPRSGTEAVLVPKDSPIRSVAELKGKRVAYNKGSNVQYFLVKLLEKHGLKYGDVQSVFLAPADARAAFERGSVDAWVIWDPFLAAAQHTLGARLLADATGAALNRQFYFTSHKYVAQNAAVLRIALEEVNAIERWAQQNPQAAAPELAAVLGLDPAIIALHLRRTSFGVVAVTPEILAEQQDIADTFYALKLIPKKIDVRQASSPVALI